MPQYGTTFKGGTTVLSCEEDTDVSRGVLVKCKSVLNIWLAVFCNTVFVPRICVWHKAQVKNKEDIISEGNMKVYPHCTVAHITSQCQKI